MNKRNFILVLIFLFLNYSCAHTVYLNRLPERKAQRQKDVLRQQTVDIRLIDGTRYTGTQIAFTDDTIRWLDREKKLQCWVPTRCVKELHYKSDWKGALDGAKWGTITTLSLITTFWMRYILKGPGEMSTGTFVLLIFGISSIGSLLGFLIGLDRGADINVVLSYYSEFPEEAPYKPCIPKCVP